jgi:hypothetical protein
LFPVVDLLNGVGVVVVETKEGVRTSFGLVIGCLVFGYIDNVDALMVNVNTIKIPGIISLPYLSFSQRLKAFPFLI